jgi:hypothetical protein
MPKYVTEAVVIRACCKTQEELANKDVKRQLLKQIEDSVFNGETWAIRCNIERTEWDNLNSPSVGLRGTVDIYPVDVHPQLVKMASFEPLCPISKSIFRTFIEALEK